MDYLPPAIIGMQVGSGVVQVKVKSLTAVAVPGSTYVNEMPGGKQVEKTHFGLWGLRQNH